MARPLRIEFPGAVYHITSRGNAKQNIFLDENDFKEFLAILCHVVKRYNWFLHAYCLMNNHYHLIVETPEGNLSIGMRQLNGIYTQRFNKRHHRVGHLFQGRFKAILVDKESYLLELCRYIVLNPVRAGLTRDPNEWKWSSYRSTIGKTKPIECLGINWILSQFGQNISEAKREFRRFVRAGIGESPLKEVKGQIVLGRDDFVERIKGLLKEKEQIKEIPKIQRYFARPSLEEVLKVKNKKQLEKRIYEAHVNYGYTLKEIADMIDVHYSTVSRIVQRVESAKSKT
ncbi:MAG: addiction module toxin RelE [Nitrospirae bacterium]|nr:addiction module toxin RelE [Nitrospirota bacterium]